MQAVSDLTDDLSIAQELLVESTNRKEEAEKQRDTLKASNTALTAKLKKICVS